MNSPHVITGNFVNDRKNNANARTGRVTMQRRVAGKFVRSLQHFPDRTATYCPLNAFHSSCFDIPNTF